MKKALLADDDFLVRSYLKMLTSWERAGFEITADVRDGEEALEALEKEPVDLVVTDLSMPLMDGIQLITEIRKKYPDIYIIVLSCHDEFEYVKKAMKEGADEYVLKNSLNEESLYTLLEAASEQLEKSLGKAPIEEDSKEESKEEIKESGEAPEEGYSMNEKFLFFNQILAGTLQGQEREEKRIRVGISGKYKNSAVIVIKKEDTEACDLLDQVKALQKKKEKREFLERVGGTVEAMKDSHCDSALIEQWFKKLARSLQVESVKEELHFSCIQEVEEALDRLGDLAFKAEKQALPENISAPVKMAAEYVNKHYREDIGLGEAAEAAGVNSSYLSYLFSQEMGTGFANYLLRLRLDHAKKLLRESNMKMWQVAEESGFNDYHYFSKSL